MISFLSYAELMKGPINAAYGYYLMASYLYYMLDRGTPFSDSEYDLLCRRLVKDYDDITHKLKHLTNKELLIAGSGYTIQLHSYPIGLRSTAELWSESLN